jgi:hypothetical protein
MKKLLGMAVLVVISHAVFAQSDTSKDGKPKVTYASLNLKNRPNDHFMIEFSYDNWLGKTDSMNTSGFSRGFAFYFMYDFPFKTDPHWSIGAGIGIGASNIFFDKTEVMVADAGNQTLAFPSTAGSDHFKKYKLVTTNLEVPLEVRYVFNPENTNKSWKIAVGFKPGILLSAYTKGKDLYTAAGQLENSFIQKQSSKEFFTPARVAGSIRVNYGFIGVFGQLQLTPLLKNGAGPSIEPYSIGLVLSGL